MKNLDDIKFGRNVMNALETPGFFADLANRTSLDHKTLQRTLAKLTKHGYIVKTTRGEWQRT